MKLPGLYGIARKRSGVTAFGGYCHTPGCAEGQWYEEKNLSARSWPALSPRLPRTLVATLKKPNGLYAKNGLIWVDGDRLFDNGLDVGQVQDSPKTFCGIGSKVLIWPDKVYLDTTDQTLHPLGAKWEATGNVGFAPAREDGTAYTVTASGASAPEAPANGDYWLDTGGQQDVLRVWSEANGSWSAIATSYLRLSAAGIGAAFARYDTVTVQGVAAEAVGQAAADALNTDLTVWDRGEDWITVTGLLDKAAQQTPAQGKITLERRVPDLDYLTESDNRVWGCSSKDHAVYACKLGDPTNWYSYLGTAADSYAATVGSDGDFTGAAACLGYVLLFKAGCIHKVYGTKPANYQITTVACPGVCPGGAASLTQQGQALYYLAQQGVMRYDGSLPVCISENFGAGRYTAGAGGAAGGQVAMSVQDADGQWTLFCYDTARSLWHKQDELHALAFAAQGEQLLALAADGGLWALGCPQDPYAGHPGRETAVEWSAETGDIGLYTPDRKYVVQVALRMQAQPGTTLTLEAQYDSSGRWEQLASLTAADKRQLTLPLTPRRCDHIRLRLRGKGEMTLYALTKTTEQGSER